MTNTDNINADGLRVALFSGNYNYVMDGPVRALNKLVAHLEKRGASVLVFAPTVDEPAFAHSGELVSIPSLALPGSRSEYRLGFGLVGEAKRRLNAFAPNLVHIAAPDITGFQALKYAEATGATPVASFHTRFDTYPRYYGAKWLEKHLTNYMRNVYGRCVHVYAPSQSMREELLRDGIGKDIRIWTRGVESDLFSPGQRDLEWRRRNGVEDDDILIAFVGRVVLEKGIDVFAEAITLASRSNPKIRALVVGEGPERARFEANLPTGVFTGYQQGADLARAYASADIFFNPSITETFGNVTLEAMASGLPTIAAAASGSLSLVEDNVTGKLSPPEKGAAGYAALLVDLAADAQQRAHMSAHARKKSLEFSWDSVLDDLIANYRSAMATHQR
ncbi:MAG: glycosyltransferase family 1 protein [Parvularculaceae bacterium]|nr:MAG: glycosyltransferase family 1 protein [Parvularculaceae bacterium]